MHERWPSCPVTGLHMTAGIVASQPLEARDALAAEALKPVDGYQIPIAEHPIRIKLRGSLGDYEPLTKQITCRGVAACIE